MARNWTIQFSASNAFLPSSNFAAPGQIPTTLTPCHAFDADTDETLYLIGIVPAEHTGSGTLKFKIIGCSSATSGNTARFDTAMENRTPGANEAANSASFGTGQSVTITDSTTAYGIVQGVITMTPTTTPVAGDLFRLAVTRDANNGSSLDTLAADFLAMGYELYEEV